MFRLPIVSPCIFLLLSLFSRLAASGTFGDVLALSYRFYEAQMSGNVPTWSRAAQVNGGWRNRSHIFDGFGPDGINVDLSGGWYDGAGHLKLHLPLGVSASLLAYGALTWESAYRTAGLWDTAVRNLDWVATYLVKCHYLASNNASANAFVAQIGDPTTDANYWGRPEQQRERGANGTVGWRPVQVITTASAKGADIVAEAAATLAGVSLLLKRSGTFSNPGRAAQLLGRARQLFAFAQTLRLVWTPDLGTVMYSSSTFQDDMAWAAAWLCRADLEANVSASASPYCGAALRYWDLVKGSTGVLTVDNVAPAAALLLRDIGVGAKNYTDSYDLMINRLLMRWMNLANCSTGSPPPCYAPGGLAWQTVYSPLRYAANVALLAVAASRFDGGGGAVISQVSRVQRMCWAKRQLSYMVGLPPNTKGQSFVVGYSPLSTTTSPARPTHKSSSCNRNYTVPCNWAARVATTPNPNVLAGALVGGPGRDGSYADVRTDLQKNEVTLDKNAGFTGALAGLLAVEQRMAAQGSSCTWDAFCAYKCNPFPTASSPPPPPSPSPRPPSSPPSPSPPSPSPSPAPQSPSPPSSPPPTSSPPPLDGPILCNLTDFECNKCANDAGIKDRQACRTCIFDMRAKGFNPWTCFACTQFATDATNQRICMLECLPQKVGTSGEFACSQYCAAPAFVASDAARSRECIGCITNANIPNSWDCSNCMTIANAQAVDPAAARASCIRCLGSGPAGVSRSYPCGECIRKGTQELRDWCIKCVTTSTLGYWGCDQCIAKFSTLVERNACANIQA